MKLSKYSYKFIWFIIPVVIILLDQGTKYLALKHLTLNGSMDVFPGMSFTLMYNMGAAFSFLASQMGWQRWVLSIIAIIVCICILIWFFRLPRKQVLLHFSLMCILGGAIGNLIDRTYYGFVIDFLDFYYQSWHWYTFNLADAAITLGAGLIILDTFLEGRKK